MATAGTRWRRRSARWDSRAGAMALISRRSLAMRSDATAVQLDLGLTGSPRAHARPAGRHAAAGLPGHRLAPAAQSGQQVLQLGQLHLGLALPGLGVLGEDVQDEGGAVDDL